MNRRADRWGGSLENRARLARAARCCAVRAATWAARSRWEYASHPKISATRAGLDLDESVQTARWLADDGADFVHVSLWHALANTKKRPHRARCSRFFAPRFLPISRILTAGSIWTRAEADEMLARGADGIALGRAAIVNPDWPRRAPDPAWHPKRPPVTIAELRERGLGPRFRRIHARAGRTSSRIEPALGHVPAPSTRFRARATGDIVDISDPAPANKSFAIHVIGVGVEDVRPRTRSRHLLRVARALQRATPALLTCPAYASEYAEIATSDIHAGLKKGARPLTCQ